MIISIIDTSMKLVKCRYLHRDIKPGNFAIGKKNLRQIYLLDFGMCRRYLDKQGSTVRNPRRLAGFRGTVRLVTFIKDAFKSVSIVV